MANYPAKHEFVDDYPYLAYASEADTVAGSGEGGSGGGGSYTLPVASADTLGGVKIGSGLAIDSDGVLSSSGGASINIVEVRENNQNQREIAETAENLYQKLLSGVVYAHATAENEGVTINGYIPFITFSKGSNNSYSFTLNTDLYTANSSNDYPTLGL